MATRWRVNVLGGWTKEVQADSEHTAKTEALKMLRIAGHSLRPPNRDRSESYVLEDQKEGVTVTRRAEVHAIRLDVEG